ncbi:MAG: PAS domain S-box protein, partial [Methanomassiliicoccales archaeon]
MIRILYADDEPMMLDLTKEFLEMDPGLSVEIVASAAEAIGTLQRQTYDVVISDYQMPGMDGLEFLRWLRSSGNNVPFILFTGKGREDVVVKALDDGADYYVQKGTDTKAQFAELRHKVRLVNERRTATKAFKESEERHRSLFETMNQGVIYLDDRGKVLAANPAALAFLGAKPEELEGLFSNQGKPLLTDLGGAPITSEETPWAKAMRENRTIKSEVVMMVQGRDRGVFEVSCIPAPVETGAAEQYYVIFNELTDRYRADASERRFRELFDNMEEGVALHRMVLDASGEAVDYEVLEVNRGFERLIGLKRTEVVGQLASELYGVGVAPYLQEYAKVASSGEPYRFEAFYAPLGKHLIISAISSHKGFFATAFFDITDIKTLESSLQELNEVIRALLDAQKEMTFLLRPDGTILVANRTACRKLGKDLEEMRRLKVTDIVDQETWERYQVIGTRVMRTGQGEVFEDLLQGREYEFNIHPVRNISGNVDRLAVTIYDITELRGALQEAAAGEMRLSLAVEGIGDGIWDMDMVSNQVAYSKRLEEMLGYVPGEIGSNRAGWQALVHPEDLEMVREDYQRFVADGCHLYSSEHRLLCRDGNYRWVLDRGVVIERLPDGTPKRMVGTHMDITRRKLMEEALRREEDKFHSLVEQSTDGVVLVGTSGKLVLVNGAFERITGMSRGTLIGSTIFDIQQRMTINMPEKGANDRMVELVTAMLQGSASARMSESFEVEFLNPDERKMNLTLKPFPIRTETGMMMGVIVVDNTERHLSEDALHLANTKLNLLNSITRHDILNQVMILKMNVERERVQARDQDSRQRLEKIAKAVENIRRQVSFTSDYQDMGVQAPE